jgi:hypothetical protein
MCSRMLFTLISRACRNGNLGSGVNELWPTLNPAIHHRSAGLMIECSIFIPLLVIGSEGIYGLSIS